jgi:hypothetical protein
MGGEEVEYIVKWRSLKRPGDSEMKSPTKAGAELWALARMREGVKEVLIEDERGDIVVTYEQLLPKLKNLY